jgi:hypothetical protein
MKQLICKAAGALLTALLLITPKAKAQDPIVALDPTLMAGWSGNLAYSKSASGRAATSAKTNFAYTSTPALRQQVVARFARRLESQNAKGARALTAAFGPGKADYGQLYKQMLKNSVLRDNDAADALTALLLAGYQIVNNLQDNQVTSAMERGARTQVAAILAQNKSISSATARAQMAEELKLQTLLLAVGAQDAVKNKTMPAYQQNIAAMFKGQYHLDMQQLKLTAKGFAKV